MGKDFDYWNEKKKELHENARRLFFRDGEIWWAYLGINVGYEIDGKNRDFSRPVLVLKKYNQFSFLALPLSSAKKNNAYWLPIGVVSGREAFANLSQLRNIESKRLINKVGYVPSDTLSQIREKVSRINLG